MTAYKIFIAIFCFGGILVFALTAYALLKDLFNKDHD